MTMLTRRGFGVAGAALTGLSFLRPGDLLGAEASAPRAGIDPMDLVDSELKPALLVFLKQSPLEWSKETLPGMRQAFAASIRPPLAQPAFSKQTIPGASGSGSPDVNIVVIGAAADAPPRPAVLHIHGGGYIVSSVAEFMPALQRLSATHGCVVVSVDYRLAPETRFPDRSRTITRRCAGCMQTPGNSASIEAG